jgi:eukaryotic-like serine/threonine-protein kinase
MVGKIVSHYHITEKLGGGGMGVVYKAEDTRLHRTVALKFLPRELNLDEEAKKRFILEAEAASSLDHNNICVIHEIDETDGQIFICMNYYEGETLKKKIEKGLLKIDEAADIGLQIAKGLQKAHEKGIIHRDIKPANIFITGDDVVKILDFGLAKLSSYSALTKVGETLGTTTYMSPEQSKGEKTDHRTDIWSLGVVLYEMLTGKLPFKGDYEQAVIYSIMNEEPEPVTGVRSNVPMEFEHIISKCIRKQPAERYQHIDEVIVDLKNLLKLSEASSETTLKTLPTQKKSFYGKNKKYIIPAAVILISAIVYLVYIFISNEDILLSEPTPIAVITFENQTGDAAFDYLQKAIPNLLITNLEQSNYFRVTTWERMQDLLNQMGKYDVNIIDRDMGFDICRRDGVDIIVIGSYVKAGNIFATDIKVLDVETKQIIKSASSRGEGIGSILESQIDELSKEISQGAGISYSKITAERMKVVDVTTKTMEAYNYFIKGRDNYDKFYFNEARENLEKAIEIDTTFASAYLNLAYTYNQLKNVKERNIAIRKAYDFASKATEKERLIINSFYALAIEGNGEQRLATLKELILKYPKEKSFYYDLGVYYHGKDNPNEALKALNKALELDPDFSTAINQAAYIYGEKGNYSKAIEYLQRYSKLNPGDANPYDSMGDYFWLIGQSDKAAEYYMRCLEIKHDFVVSASKLAYIYMEKENYQEAEKWTDRAIEISDDAGSKAINYWEKAFLRSWQGRFRDAEIELEKARELAISINNKYLQAGCDWLQAYVSYESDALAKVNEYYKGWTDYRSEDPYPDIPVSLLDYKFIAALVHLKQNYIDSAKVIFSEMKSTFPDFGNNGVHSKRYNILNAEILLAEKKNNEAIKDLKNAVPPDNPKFSYYFAVSYNTPFQKDVLARAYSLAGQTDNAIAEYKKLITFNPLEKDRYLIHPKYYYQLALLYEKKGIKEEAIKYYNRFLEFWKDADPGLSEIIDAKKQLKKLSAG